jgi:hypothetical protein
MVNMLRTVSNAESTAWNHMLQDPNMANQLAEKAAMMGVPLTPETMTQLAGMAHEQLSTSVDKWKSCDDFGDLKDAAKKGDVGAAIRLRELAASKKDAFPFKLDERIDNWLKDECPSLAAQIGVS